LPYRAINYPEFFQNLYRHLTFIAGAQLISPVFSWAAGLFWQLTNLAF
jgi:hypothetical protein